MHVLFQKTHISYGSFLALKPFCIFPPTETEKESCMCPTCLNIHVICDVLCKNVKLPSSLSQFLTADFNCEVDSTTNYHRLDCLSSECGNGCKIMNKSNEIFRNVDVKKLHSYYAFERVPTFYYNTNGEKVSYIRTTRVNKEGNLEFLYDKLLSMAKKYVIHRFFVATDKVFWSKFITNYRFPVLTLDYSENIALKPKFEVQAAHFRGRQHMLHCCVMESDGVNNYVYHLSDDTTHDNIITFSILKDLVETYPEILANGKLILRSDASTQYKSRFVFHDMKEFAKEFQVLVAWFHEEAGHGRGLVDSMSSFGCKAVLRNAIATSNLWFLDAESMAVYCQKHFEGDSSKSYHLIDPESTASERQKPREAHPLAGCMKYHMIAVDKHGVFTTRIVLDPNDDQLLNLYFNVPADNVDESITEILEEPEKVLDLPEVEDSSLPPMLFEITPLCSYIGLRSPPSSLELFFVVKVLAKNIAYECINDKYGHVIVPGEPYFTVMYLDKVTENKSGVQFRLSNKNAETFIHLEEVFTTNIEMTDKLLMPMGEYLALCQELY